MRLVTLCKFIYFQGLCSAAVCHHAPSSWYRWEPFDIMCTVFSGPNNLSKGEILNIPLFADAFLLETRQYYIIVNCYFLYLLYTFWFRSICNLPVSDVLSCSRSFYYLAQLQRKYMLITLWTIADPSRTDTLLLMNAKSISLHMSLSSLHFYHQPAKLREGNAFTSVCIHGRGDRVSMVSGPFMVPYTFCEGRVSLVPCSFWGYNLPPKSLPESMY